MRVPSSTLFLKAIIILIGAVVLVLCVVSFPNVLIGAEKELPDFLYVVYPGLIGFYGAIIPFLFALFQAFTLLQYIDANNAFSELSVRALKNIKYCAIAMTLLYWTAMPLVYVFAELDDAPGAIIIGAAFACAPLVVATFAAVLQKLIQSGVTLKQENDLTV